MINSLYPDQFRSVTVAFEENRCNLKYTEDFCVNSMKWRNINNQTNVNNIYCENCHYFITNIDHEGSIMINNHVTSQLNAPALHEKEKNYKVFFTNIP